MWGPISYVQAFEWLIQVLSRASGVPTVSTSNEMLKWSVMLRAADPWEPLSTGDLIFFLSSFGFWSVIYQWNGHWDYAGKWHFKGALSPSPPPSQIGPNQRTMGVPQYCRIQIFKNLDKIQLFPMSALNSDCLSKGFLKGFLVPEAFWTCSTF